MNPETEGYWIGKTDAAKDNDGFALLIVDDMYAEACDDSPEDADARLVRHATMTASKYREIRLIVVSGFRVDPSYSHLNTYIRENKLLCLVDLTDSENCFRTLTETWKIPASRIAFFTKSNDPSLTKTKADEFIVIEKSIGWAYDGGKAYSRLENKLRFWLSSQLYGARDIWLSKDQETLNWFKHREGSLPHTPPDTHAAEYNAAREILEEFFAPLCKRTIPAHWFEAQEWQHFYYTVREIYGDKAPRFGGPDVFTIRGLGLLAVLSAPGEWMNNVYWSKIKQWQVLPKQTNEQALESCKAFNHMVRKLAYPEGKEVLGEELQLLRMVGDDCTLSLFFDFSCSDSQKGPGHDPLLKQLIDHRYTGDAGEAVRDFLSKSCVTEQGAKDSCCVINIRPSENHKQTILEIRPCKR